jgi:glycerate 2-kinase
MPSTQERGVKDIIRAGRIKNAKDLVSRGNILGRNQVVAMLEAGLEAADPYHNTRKLLRLDSGKLIVGCKSFEIPADPKEGEETFDLSKLGDIYVLGAAKGVQCIAKAIEDVLGDRLTGGHVIAKKGDDHLCKKIEVTEGGHPLPDEDCVKGSERILELAERARRGDLVFTISGNGGSSLLTLPPRGISLEDVREVTYLMQIEHGAPTSDLNVVRNHIDLLKAGRLSEHIHPATMIHILAWDLSGTPLPRYDQILGSNVWLHALPDNTTFADAVSVLRKWDAWEKTPSSIKQHLTRADPQYETSKTDDFRKMSFRIFFVLPRRALIEGARRKAEELNLASVVLTDSLLAEAREAGKVIAQIARSIELNGEPFKPPCVLLTCGEMLVTVGEENGVGGRNQEFALSAALEIANSSNIVIGAVDSDGTDGPGDHFKIVSERLPCLAGGIVDGHTVDRAKSNGLDIAQELRKHNTSHVLRALGDGIIASKSISLDDLGVTLVLSRA